MAGAQKTSQFDPASSVAATDEVPLLQGGQLKRVPVGTLVGLPDVGWIAAGETWQYASWSATTRTGVLTVPTDATTKYTLGMRVSFTQTTGGKKYGIIHAITATTMTVFFPVGTTLNNETITGTQFSTEKIPYGFNADPSAWTLETVEAGSSTTISNPSPVTGGVWNGTGISVVVPVGKWRLSYNSTYQATGSGASVAGYMSAHYSASVPSPSNFSALIYRDSSGVAYGTVFLERIITVTSQQTWQIYVGRGGSTLTNITTSSPSATQTSFIKAVSAYL